ncbi:MAG: alpha/beta fold hydrolase [Hyphomicrobiaceae bacterium]
MEIVDVRGTPVEALIAGSGPPLLYLHPEQLFDQTRSHIDALAQHWRVIAPRHPGFGTLPMPGDFRSVDDIAYLYLDLLEKLDLKDVVVVGGSFGGWIALEMGVRNTSRIAKLVLVSSVGVKLSNRDERDFADLFYLPEGKLFETLLADPAQWAPRFAELDITAVETIARERQATAFYGWKPYLHNPILKRWLHRIGVPTLVIWGEQDRFAAPSYGRQLAERLPNAELRIVPGAGHYPHIEQSAQVIRMIEAFASR